MSLTNITEQIARALFDAIRVTFVGSTRVSVDPANIAAGLQVTNDVSVVGALLGDYVLVGVETILEAGLEMTAYVSAADTVRLITSNNTAGAIDPTAKNYTFTVLRRA